ncbi:MAG TPA: PEP-utilizing enzyme [Acidimicrobiales bacterium]|nr:PEP-utilizing enzyme [Acidimicrobiales bacterium]
MPVSRLFATLFPPTVIGWQRAAVRYGWPIQSTTFASVNGFLYYSPGETDWDATSALDPVAEHTLAAKTWRDEVRRWRDGERLQVVRADLALQVEHIGAMDDAALADHIGRAITNFLDVAPLHFEHSGFDIAAGLLISACGEWGVDAADATALLAGSSPATAAVAMHIERIVAGLHSEPQSLDDVRSASEAAGQGLESLLAEHGWRVIDGNDLAGPTLGERPDLLLAAIRARMEDAPRRADHDVDRVRDRVPEAERERFDVLLDDARASYSLRDDDNGVCFVWPLGLIRRGVLEAGLRLDRRGAVRDVDDLFEAVPEEISALLAGRGPSADDLAARRAARIAARTLDPPSQLGDMPEEHGPALPPHVAELDAIRNVYFAATSRRSAGDLRGLGIGTCTVRGPARLLTDGDAIDRIEHGDVLIAVTTTCNLNSVFPLLAGVATEEGGLFSHTALLARELGVPAVVGAPGLLSAICDGDIVEVDPVAGIVRVIERA